MSYIQYLDPYRFSSCNDDARIFDIRQWQIPT